MTNNQIGVSLYSKLNYNLSQVNYCNIIFTIENIVIYFGIRYIEN